MKQKLMIQVNANQPLSEAGQDHVLLYDSSKGEYFAISRDVLLSAQNAEIRKLNYNFEMFKKNTQEQNEKFQFELSKKYQEQHEALIRQFAEYKEQNDKRYHEFLVQFQETNDKLIKMVKSLMEES